MSHYRDECSGETLTIVAPSTKYIHLCRVLQGILRLWQAKSPDCLKTKQLASIIHQYGHSPEEK